MSSLPPLDVSQARLDEAQARLEAAKVDYVRFEQTDTHGISRSKTIPSRHFHHFASNGLNFLLGQLGFDVQGGVAPGTGYLEERGFPDSRIFPDLDTLAILPWAEHRWKQNDEWYIERTARLLCEPRFQDGSPAMAAPRAVARAMLAELANLGYDFFSGYEYECYFVDADTREPPFPGIQIFATLRNNFDPHIIDRILRELSEAGVDIITSNAEYGPGQMEINFAAEPGIKAADTAFTFKNGIKEIVQNHSDYMVTFMTKPYADQSANGCHYHHSLIDLASRQNAFSNPDDPFTLNQTCRWWLGGLIRHAAALTALASPTVNCYKRYKLYSFAPTNATWGVENRTVGFRVKVLKGEGAHLENRLPGGASNPYLVMASTIAAGIDGLQNKIDPPPAVDGIAYGMKGVTDLPTNLGEALDALEADKPLCDALGEEFIHLFLAVKRYEIKKAAAAGADITAADFRGNVTQFETDEYFEFL